MPHKGRAGLASQTSTRARLRLRGLKLLSGREEGMGCPRGPLQGDPRPTTRGASKEEVVAIQKRQKGTFMGEQRERWDVVGL